MLMIFSVERKRDDYKVRLTNLIIAPLSSRVGISNIWIVYRTRWNTKDRTFRKEKERFNLA